MRALYFLAWLVTTVLAECLFAGFKFTCWYGRKLDAASYRLFAKWNSEAQDRQEGP